MPNRLSCGVVIPAAGRGTRMDAALPKQFMELEGKSILLRSIEHFQSSPEVDWIVIPAAREDIGKVEETVRACRLSKVSVVQGGEKRQDSVWNGIQALKNRDPGIVLIHDAVRPFITQQLIQSLLLELADHDSAIVAVPVKETTKLADEQQIVTSTPDRKFLWNVQTPQAFRFPVLLRAYEAAYSERYYSTDDAGLVERIGGKVKIVPGSYDNIKITTPEDFELARLIVRRTTQASAPVDSL